MSSTMQKLFAEFPPVSTAEWEAAIVKDLRGRDPKTLVWKTEDGIEVKPFYRSADLAGVLPLEATPTGRGWHVGCEVNDEAALRRALDHGVQAVIVPPAVAGDVPIHEVSIHVKARSAGSGGLSRNASGSFVVDPIAEFTPDQAVDHFRLVQATTPGMAPFVIDGTRYHNAAATITQELAFSIATGVECLVELTEAHLPAGAVAAQTIFAFGIGSNYFFEIAKLRAARILWRKAVAAFDPRTHAEIRIQAHTSKWNKTAYDPYVNLLRTTTEAMSAVIGGCEMLNVGAFDEVWKAPNEFSQRLAINTQLVLRDEAHFARSGDPAAGSWYIESLTTKVAETAWKIFQEVEAAGGMRKALASGFVEQAIGTTRAKRNAAIDTRKRVFVGVNQYPNASEHAVPELVENGIANSRGAFAFEAMRLATDRYAAKTGSRPLIFLARLGDPKMSRARAEFTANYFGCAGFAIADSPGYDTPEEAVAAIAKADPAAVVLCSSDAEYPTLAAAICTRVTPPVIVAGYPKELVDALLGAGVSDFVYLGSNAVDVLTRWQKRLGLVS